MMPRKLSTEMKRLGFTYIGSERDMPCFNRGNALPTVTYTGSSSTDLTDTESWGFAVKVCARNAAGNVLVSVDNISLTKLDEAITLVLSAKRILEGE